MNMNRLVWTLICMILVVSACSSEESSAPRMPVNMPDQVIENSTIIFSEKGIKSAAIHAAEVAVYEKLDLKKATKLHVDFYDQEGNLTSVLVADSGLIQEKKQKFEARGNVVVTTQEGVKLTTESLRWNPETNKIVTDDFVTITKGKDVITGIGLEADEQLKHFFIKKRVQAQIKEVPAEDFQDSL
jgi:LPS export ABC transporter protein LptC